MNETARKWTKWFAGFLAGVAGILTTIACGSGGGGVDPEPPPIDQLPPVLFIADRETNDVFELWISAKAGEEIVKLSGTMTSGGDVTHFKISNDGTKVAYRADQETNDRFELFVNTINVGTSVTVGTPVKVNGALNGSQVADDFEWAPDDSRIAYRAKQRRGNEFDLYTVLPNGSSNTQAYDDLDMIAGGQVTEFEWAPDVSRIAYRADQDELNVFKLYTSLPDGTNNVESSNIGLAGSDVFEGIGWATDSSVLAYIANQRNLARDDVFNGSPIGSTTVNISDITVDGRQVFEFDWSPNFANSRRLAYTTDRVSPGSIDLFTAPINAIGTSVSGSLPVGGTVDEFDWAPNSIRIAYLANQDNPAIVELFTTSPNVISVLKVSGPLLAGRNVFAFAWQPNSQRIAYLANQDIVTSPELYMTLPNALNTDIRVSGTLVSGGIVRNDFAWASDSSLIAYRADQETINVVELYTVTSTGTRNTKISGELVSGGNVENFLWDPSSDGVAYLADEDTDEVFELYITLSDGSNGAKISGAIVPGGNVLDGYQWVP